MIVAVGTKNPAKLEGVRNAFAKFYPDFELRSIDGSAVSRKQPVGLEQITEGAMERAKFALKATNADFGVGVEAGIFKMGGHYFDHQQAAVVDRSGRVSLGYSAGFMLPTGGVERMLAEGRELEDLAVELTGIPEVGDKGGIINFLTNGAMSRSDLTEQCVVTALAPWLHRDVYGF